MGFTLFGVKEKPANREASSLREQKPAPVSMKRIWKTIAGNDQLRWVALAFLLHQIGNGLASGGLASTYIYMDFGYSGGLYSVFNTVTMLATAVIMVAYPAIGRRVPRKALMRVMLTVSAAGYGVALLSGLLMQGATARFWGITLGYMLANFGQFTFYLIMMISIINTVEYNEYMHGTRDEAIITSLRPFLTKLGSALIVVLISLSYMAFSVTDTTNGISRLESAASQGLITEAEKLASIEGVLAEVQPWQTQGLFLVIILVPLAMMTLSYLIYRRHYRLDEGEYDRICAELTRRKGEAA